MNVSEKDKEIISILIEDARSSLKNIADEVDMSENGVRYRIDRLEKEGIIKGYTTRIDMDKMGRSLGAVFFIKPEQGIEMNDLGEFLLGLDEIYNVIYITGERPFVAMGNFRDKDGLRNFLETNLVSNRTIKDLDYHLVLDESLSNDLCGIMNPGNPVSQNVE